MLKEPYMDQLKFINLEELERVNLSWTQLGRNQYLDDLSLKLQ